MERLDMSQVETLWSEGRSIPLELAPIALWHLNETPQPPEDKVMPYSEEQMGDLF